MTLRRMRGLTSGRPVQRNRNDATNVYPRRMDTFLTIASRREDREYSPDDLPDEQVERILVAGRCAGSAKNRQPVRFTALRRGHPLTKAIADSVTRPSNISEAALLVIVSVIEGRKALFDAGRGCQNMLLAAWSEGIGSCPNTVKDDRHLKEILGMPEEETAVTVLSFGYPTTPRNVARRSAMEWSDKLDRLPLEELVRWP